MLPNIVQGNEVFVDDKITTYRAGGEVRIRITPAQGAVRIGGFGEGGDLLVFPETSEMEVATACFHVDGESGVVFVGGGGVDGKLVIRDGARNQKILLDGNSGHITVGRSGSDGGIVIRTDDDEARILIGDGPTSSTLRIRLSASTGAIVAGGAGTSGRWQLVGPLGESMAECNGGNLELRSGGSWEIFNAAGDLVASCDGPRLVLGDDISPLSKIIQLDGEARRIIITNDGKNERIRLDGADSQIRVGGAGGDGGVSVLNKNGDEVITLDGGAGDIVLSNADCCEEFDTATGDEIDAGTVVVIAEDGSMQPCDQAYDKRVAGVVSGAGPYRPAMILDRRPSQRVRAPVALMGKVFCMVDASYGAVHPGDLLTASPTVGHAMKATDPSRAYGSVMGKALAGVLSGKALIPVLVTLH